MKQFIIVAILVPAMLSGSTGMAQEGLATSLTLRGRNTIQLAPSGGSTAGRASVSDHGGDQGRPTQDEVRQERQDNAASQICKGC